MAPTGKDNNALLGAGLQCMEAGTLGLPFEVVKTFMGRNRSYTTLSAVQYVFQTKGLFGFYDGFWPKMIESALKGPLLLVSKEAVRDACLGASVPSWLAGSLAGAVGGVSQTLVIAPMTFLVTKKVSSTSDVGHVKLNAFETIQSLGIRGLYAGAVPIAFRQASNWALRQGFVDFFRTVMFKLKYAGDPTIKKLTKWDEVMCGIMGGTCACINQPFEVARIEMQWRQATAPKGTKMESMPTVMRQIVQERGILGLYAAITPRICLSVWQTLFMVTFAQFVIDHLKSDKSEKKVVN